MEAYHYNLQIALFLGDIWLSQYLKPRPQHDYAFTGSIETISKTVDFHLGCIDTLFSTVFINWCNKNFKNINLKSLLVVTDINWDKRGGSLEKFYPFMYENWKTLHKLYIAQFLAIYEYINTIIARHIVFTI